MSSCSSSTQNQTRISSYGDTTTSFRPSESGLSVFLFSTTTVMIPIHPRMCLVKTYFYQRNQPNRHLCLTAAAVDTKKGGIFDDHAMDDNDEPWLSETDHRTGWNKDFKSGTYRGMLYGIVLRDYPKQVVSQAPRQRVCQRTCVNFSLGHKDTTALT